MWKYGKRKNHKNNTINNNYADNKCTLLSLANLKRIIIDVWFRY